MNSNLEAGRKELGILERVLEYSGRIAGTFTLFVASTYFIGFIVIALRLDAYGIALTSLINPYYIAAGIVPVLLLLLTGSVVISGVRYHPKETLVGLPAAWLRASIFFSVTSLLYSFLNNPESGLAFKNFNPLFIDFIAQRR